MRNHVEFIIQANILGCSVLIEQCSSENTRISALWRLTHSHKHNFVGRKNPPTLNFTIHSRSIVSLYSFIVEYIFIHQLSYVVRAVFLKFRIPDVN